MFDIYEYFESCKKDGIPGEQALRELQRDIAEYEADLIEELEDRQSRTAWQQDLIDLHRFER